MEGGTYTKTSAISSLRILAYYMQVMTYLITSFPDLKDSQKPAKALSFDRLQRVDNIQYNYSVTIVQTPFSSTDL